MSKKYKILSNFIKDMSSETPDVESYLFTKEYISTKMLKQRWVNSSSNQLTSTSEKTANSIKYSTGTL